MRKAPSPSRSPAEPATAALGPAARADEIAGKPRAAGFEQLSPRELLTRIQRLEAEVAALRGR
jgi:hypothetical protein